MSASDIAIKISAVDKASKVIEGLNKKIGQTSAPVRRLQNNFDKLADNTGVRDVGRFMGDMAKSSEQVFANISRAVPGFAALGSALSLAGLAEGMRRSADYGTHLQFTARRAGVGVGTLQRLGNAAEISGGSFEGAAGSLAELNRNMQLMAHGAQGDPRFIAALSAMHISLRGANGQMRTSASVMTEALHKLAAMHNVQQQLYFGNALLGSSFETALWPAVQGGTKALDGYLDAGARMVNLTPRQTQALREAQAQTRRLGLDVIGLANQIMSDLVPAEVKAAGGVSQWMEKNQQFIAADIAGQIRSVTKAIGSVIDGVGGWKHASSDLLEFWGAKFAPGILGPLLRADALIRAIEQYGEKHQIAGAQTAANAARGAVIGGTIGSMVPVVGTGIGAAIGGIAGGLWGNDPFGGATPADAWHYLFGGGRSVVSGPFMPRGAPGAYPFAPRGMRNNNPLNLSYMPGQGAIGSDGRFGVYRSMQDGIAADARQLLRYQDKYGLTTLRGIIGRWAPPGENDTEKYVDTVAKWMHVRPTQPLNLHDPATLLALVDAMSRYESGRSAGARLEMQGIASALGGVGPSFGRVGPIARPPALLSLPSPSTEHVVKGAAHVHIRLEGAPNAWVSTHTEGNLWHGAPKVTAPLPPGGGPALNFPSDGLPKAYWGTNAIPFAPEAGWKDNFGV